MNRNSKIPLTLGNDLSIKFGSIVKCMRSNILLASNVGTHQNQLNRLLTQLCPSLVK